SLMAGKTSFDCTNVGINTVTLTVTDASNNTDVCDATVIVEDNIAPTAVCKDITVQLDAYGVVSMIASGIDGGSDDNCTFSLMSGKTSFDCTNLGINTVTLTVTDASTNTGICYATVIVKDNIAPTIVCNPLEIVLYENGEYILNEIDIEKISKWTNDNCTAYEDLEITVFPNSFQCIHIGEPVSVKVTVVDQSGNESFCETTVTVYDKIPPVAVCEDIEVMLDDQGKAIVFPGQIDAGDVSIIPSWARTYNSLEDGSYDACGVGFISLDKQDFDCSDIGANIVTLTVTDPSGNFSICTAVVTITDSLSLTIGPINDIEIIVGPGICSTAVDYPVIVVNDNCGGGLIQTAGLGLTGMFPLGVTTETWAATNNTGNTAEVTFTVTVATTNAPPTLDSIAGIEFEEDTPPLNIILLGISDGGDCFAQDVTVAAVSTNPALVTGVAVNYTAGSVTGSLDVTIAPDMNGQSEITVTIEDSEGATTSATFTVTITPVNDPPFLANPIPDQVIIAPSVLKLPISHVLGVIFDDIDDTILAFTVMPEGGGILPAWATITADTLVCTPQVDDTCIINIVITAIDLAGATASDTFEVLIDGYIVNIGDLGDGLFEVQMYPNPTQGLVNLDINLSQIFDTEISVMNIAGEEIFRKRYKAQEQIRFDLSKHVSGMYMVTLKIDGNQIVKKLILDRK
ncbi:MAG: T9SS type A sorting domain-containing protein, partial [Prolixibacteraceae bacterium]|nr:T9SS type A sorting domain-containing protein [Prolixibacteraceae bacterium]